MPRAVILALVLTLVPAVATSSEVIPGPVRADVVSVNDGDTITVDAHPWPGVTIHTAVRVQGIDAPEIRGKCDAEKYRAAWARELARETVGERVYLRDVQLGKWAGRVVVDVYTEDGRRLADALLDAGLVWPYDGGERQGWCE